LIVTSTSSTSAAIHSDDAASRPAGHRSPTCVSLVTRAAGGDTICQVVELAAAAVTAIDRPSVKRLGPAFHPA
jgi:hypothetical protein